MKKRLGDDGAASSQAGGPRDAKPDPALSPIPFRAPSSLDATDGPADVTVVGRQERSNKTDDDSSLADYSFFSAQDDSFGIGAFCGEIK